MKILLAVVLAFSLLHLFGQTMALGKDTVNIETSIAAKNDTIGPGRPALKPPEGYVSLQPGENIPILGKVAASLLGGDYGTMTPFTVTTAVDGKTTRYMAQVDAHYHEPPPAGTPKEELYKYPKPWGWHKGVTVYKAALASLEDYIPQDPESVRLKFLDRIDQFYKDLGAMPTR